MKLGACIGMGSPERIDILKKIGYEYVETFLPEAYQADEATRYAYLDALARNGLRCESSAHPFPGTYNPAGEQTKDDLLRASDAMYEVVSKTRFMGNSILVIGAGGVRNPRCENPDWDNVYEQLAVVCREVISPICKEFGLTAALEGLQKAESPTFNLTSQAVATAKKAGCDNVRVMTDYFHIFVEQEDMSLFETFGDMIVHAHIANPAGRVMPCEGDGAGYAGFFDNLKKAGYNSRLSVEARVQGEFEPTLAAAYHEMKKYIW